MGLLFCCWDQKQNNNRTTPHYQGNLVINYYQRLVYSLREWIHDYHGREHGRRQADIAIEQYVNAYIWSISMRQKKSYVGMKWNFKTSKSTSSDTPPPQTKLPNSSQTVPQIRNQVFKYMNLWSLFSFKATHMRTHTSVHIPRQKYKHSNSFILKRRDFIFN